MATVTKKDLVDRVAAATGLKRSQVREVVQCLFDQIVFELGRGNRLEFRDFGIFETKERAPRVAQNPKTLERVEVPAKRTVKFKVGKMMQDSLDDPNLIETKVTTTWPNSFSDESLIND